MVSGSLLLKLLSVPDSQDLNEALDVVLLVGDLAIRSLHFLVEVGHLVRMSRGHRLRKEVAVVVVVVVVAVVAVVEVVEVVVGHLVQRLSPALVVMCPSVWCGVVCFAVHRDRRVDTTYY